LKPFRVKPFYTGFVPTYYTIVEENAL